MKEIRCKKCNGLLMKLDEGGEIRQTFIKCKKCKSINQIREIKYDPDRETRPLHKKIDIRRIL
jgi:phage FluMu protein Com